MTKVRYSAGLKAVAIAAQQVFTVTLVVASIILVVLFQKDILDFGDLKNKSFESSSYFSVKFQTAAEEILNFIDLRRKFETDGSYDSEKEVNIWNYYNNQEISGKTEGKKGKDKSMLRYTLGDLSEWARQYSSSSYEFSSELSIDQGIHQKQDIYKNGSSVFSEEKNITSLGEMTLELQKEIVATVEHYYGGSYSVSGAIAESGDYIRTENIEEQDAARRESTGIAEEETEDSEGRPVNLDEIIDRVIQGELYDLEGEELVLLLESMDMFYANSSVSYEFVDEDYLPVEGVVIWDAFMVGRCYMEQMRNAYAAVEFTLENIGTEINQYKRCLNLYNLTENGTNVYYWVTRGNEDGIYTNIKEPMEMQFAEYGEARGKYVFYQERDIHLETNVKGMEDAFYNRLEPRYGGKGSVFFICVDTKLPNQDNFFQAKKEYTAMRPWVFFSVSGAAISLSICLVCLIYLSMAAGRREGEERIYLNLFDRIPTEILYFFAVVEVILCFLLIGRVFYRFGNEELAGLLIMSGVLTFFCSAFLLALYLSFVRRIRAGVLWSQSILHWFVKGIGMLFTHRKSSTKMLIWFGLHLLVCFVLFSGMLSNAYDQEALFLGTSAFLLLCGVEAVLIIREGVQRNKVLEGIGKIAGGDLEYKIAVDELNGDNKRLAKAVNTIGDGLFHAVDDSMRNEHLKTDLITNVSHDIKTPLTSIINYVDLLKREELEDERVRGYIAVLDSKSQRLKQLTEDLVEASKVSSGNIKLEMERINLVELVYQTGGEFNEKFEARNLTLVTKLPKEPVVILADGRRIWRVLENLYNNVAKYAMEHTRVYVDLEADGEKVQFSIKNISENPLNIQADELTERFIRGDISRSTEGSGLGLSIAKSLTSLMGGEFEIYLDGDLFKAMVIFSQEPETRRLPLTDQAADRSIPQHSNPVE